MKQHLWSYINHQKHRWDMMANDASETHLRIIRRGSNPYDPEWKKWEAMMAIGIRDMAEATAIKMILAK